MIPDTLFGYPIVMIDDMPSDTMEMLTLGPTPWVTPRPTKVTVFDSKFNVVAQGNLKWEDCVSTWCAKVEWEELLEKEETE